MRFMTGQDQVEALVSNAPGGVLLQSGLLVILKVSP